MQHSHCPRCNMVIAPGTQSCPNCKLNLMQYAFQQQNYQETSISGETKQEKKYRKLVIVLAIVSLSELLIYRIPDVFQLRGGPLNMLIQPLEWLLELAWCGIPLAIALVLPKKNKVRILFIVLGAIFALWQLQFYVGLELYQNESPAVNVTF